jgi:hypothetical protein
MSQAYCRKYNSMRSPRFAHVAFDSAANRIREELVNPDKIGAHNRKGYKCF